MSGFEVEAEVRTGEGKGASRRLRRDGRVPAIIYGGNEAPQLITLRHNEVVKHLKHEAFYSHILTVNVGGKPTKAVLRDVQRHPARPMVMHMDFMRVDENQPIRVHVPLHFVGQDLAPGFKAGGVVSHELIEVEVEVLPKHLPEFIEVDISGLEIGGTVHLSDLKLPESCALVEMMRGESHDLMVASIHAPRRAGEEEGGAPAEGAPEAGSTP